MSRARSVSSLSLLLATACNITSPEPVPRLEGRIAEQVLTATRKNVDDSTTSVLDRLRTDSISPGSLDITLRDRYGIIEQYEMRSGVSFSFTERKDVPFVQFMYLTQQDSAHEHITYKEQERIARDVLGAAKREHSIRNCYTKTQSLDRCEF